jgi:hypothetical protein
MDYFTILIVLACATAYYHIGETEYQKGFLVAAVSVLVSVITFYGLGWGWRSGVGAQVGIFVALTVINMCRKGH